MIAPMIIGADSLHSRLKCRQWTSIRVFAISPDRRVARVLREPPIMCSSHCTKRTLSRRNAFLSEPAAHNRKLNIEAGVAALFTSDVVFAKSGSGVVAPAS
jgi:hypothetical protein